MCPRLSAEKFRQSTSVVCISKPIPIPFQKLPVDAANNSKYTQRNQRYFDISINDKITHYGFHTGYFNSVNIMGFAFAKEI